MTVLDDRAARNEALFREVNEHVQQLGERLGSDSHASEFLCECADETCIEKVSVPVDVYERVRSNPRQFLIRPGHERLEIEAIVIVSDEYLIVEKRGQAGQIAENTDPR
jgi:hypothetical protein